MSVSLVGVAFNDGAGNVAHTLLNPTVSAPICYYLTAFQVHLDWILNGAGGQSNWGIDLGSYDGTTFISFYKKSLVFMGLGAGVLTPVSRTFTLEFPDPLFIKPTALGVNQLRSQTATFQVTSVAYDINIYGILVNT